MQLTKSLIRERKSCTTELAHVACSCCMRQLHAWQAPRALRGGVGYRESYFPPPPLASLSISAFSSTSTSVFSPETPQALSGSEKNIALLKAMPDDERRGAVRSVQGWEVRAFHGRGERRSRGGVSGSLQGGAHGDSNVILTK